MNSALSGNLPKHIAIIMDGNGRWAEARNLPRSEGHRAGARAVREIVTECRRLNIPFLTLYAFSSENWKRPETEIAFLFGLLLEFLGVETPRMAQEGIRLNVIGAWTELPMPQRKALQFSMDRTAHCRDMTLNLALNYGGRAEIVAAARKLLLDQVAPESLNEEMFAKFLDTAGQPDPDLLIRTSGEERLSNFLLYQSAYSELYFTPVCWPDFNAAGLVTALQAYAARNRRFGARPEN